MITLKIRGAGGGVDELATTPDSRALPGRIDLSDWFANVPVTRPPSSHPDKAIG